MDSAITSPQDDILDQAAAQIGISRENLLWILILLAAVVFSCCFCCWICCCFARKFKISRRKKGIAAAATEGDGTAPTSTSPETELAPVVQTLVATPPKSYAKRESYQAFHPPDISTVIIYNEDGEQIADVDDDDDEVGDGIITKMDTGDIVIMTGVDPEENPKAAFRSSMNYDGDDFKELHAHMKDMNVVTKSLSNVMINTQPSDLNEEDQKMLQEVWDEDGGTPTGFEGPDTGDEPEMMDGYVDTGADRALDLIMENADPNIKANGV